VAQVVISREDLYPVGTVVDAYRAAGPTPVSGRPPYGPSAGSATVDAAGLLTYASLTENAPFILYAPAPDRYLRIFVSSSSGGGTGSSVDTATLVGFCEWSGTAWTFNSVVIIARPDFAGKLIWFGGDASTDEPTSMMGVGDIWYPASE
jgi:hypothetical protein